MKTEIRILFVEDLPSDAELIKYQLAKNDFQVISTTVETAEAYKSALSEFKPDIILSDYSLPRFNGMLALELRQELASEIPFILVTGTNNEEIAVECMKAGADDYILKDNLTRLGQAVRAAIEKKAIIRANNEAVEKLSILSRAVEQNPALILITDINGNIEYVNPKFIATTEYTSEEVLGKNPRILKSGNQGAAFYKNLWETVLSGKEWAGEFLNRKKHGDLFWESSSISPLVNEKGIITHLVGISEDVTDKRRMIEDLILAKEKAEASDKLKSAFINNISHEIRTPLSGIVGFSEMIINTDLSEENRNSFYDIIKKSSSRLLNTINNYMDISLIVSGNVEVHSKPTSLNNLLTQIYEEFHDICAAKGLELSIKKANTHGEIKINTDPELLHKIFTHLLGNAVKFTHNGTIEFGYRIKDKSVDVFVSDTGIGIEQDKTQLIFDYFMQADTSQTRGYEGSGLGLSIVRGLVKLLGGKIFVESQTGKGSTFYFSFPSGIIIPAVEEQDRNEQLPGPNSSVLILVAEDDDFNYKYLEIILKKVDYNVIRAVNGLEALNICKNNPAVNLVMMDMKMPVMGGLEATRKIRVFHPALPIIALTAYVSPYDENEALSAGCNEFLPKPVNRAKLLGLIQKTLGSLIIGNADNK